MCLQKKKNEQAVGRGGIGGGGKKERRKPNPERARQAGPKTAKREKDRDGGKEDAAEKGK